MTDMLAISRYKRIYPITTLFLTVHLCDARPENIYREVV